jgi:hypothetical protein
MTIKEGLYQIRESVILYLTVDFPFCKRKKIEPSLLAINIDWFTNCNWREQMNAFGQFGNYYAYKL